eukprot:FR743964.1.p4 GENE.FR743964.1~~FR743964.1.p4  ORF type:complete len:106 (+),score=39.91 FR743964.1:808-1125(+)
MRGNLRAGGNPGHTCFPVGKLFSPSPFPPNIRNPKTKKGKARGGPKEGAKPPLIGVCGPPAALSHPGKPGRGPRVLIENPPPPAGERGVFGVLGGPFSPFPPPLP